MIEEKMKYETKPNILMDRAAISTVPVHSFRIQWFLIKTHHIRVHVIDSVILFTRVLLGPGYVDDSVCADRECLMGYGKPVLRFEHPLHLFHLCRLVRYIGYINRSFPVQSPGLCVVRGVPDFEVSPARVGAGVIYFTPVGYAAVLSVRVLLVFPDSVDYVAWSYCYNRRNTSSHQFEVVESSSITLMKAGPTA